MKKTTTISLKDLHLAMHGLCLLTEAGVSWDSLRLEEDGPVFESLRLLYGLPVDARVTAEGKEFIESSRRILQFVSETGASFTPIFFPILESEQSQGFCKKSNSRKVLRMIALGIKAGMSSQQSILRVLEIEQGPQDFMTEPVAYMELDRYLKEPALTFSLPMLEILRTAGANLSQYFLFLAGSTKF